MESQARSGSILRSDRGWEKGAGNDGENEMLGHMKQVTQGNVRHTNTNAVNTHRGTNLNKMTNKDYL
jgi:hypothetical protein